MMIIPCGRWDTDHLVSKLPESLVLRHKWITEYDIHWNDYKRNVKHILRVADELFQNYFSPGDGDQGRPREGPRLQLRAWIDWNTWEKILLMIIGLQNLEHQEQFVYNEFSARSRTLPDPFGFFNQIGLLNSLCCIDIESPWSRTIFSSWALNSDPDRL